MNKQYYRFIVLYTMKEEDGNIFVNNVENIKSLKLTKLTDQSSFAVHGDNVAEVKQLLLKAVSSIKNSGEYFINMYYSAALVNIKKEESDKWDYIVEEKIW